MHHFSRVLRKKRILEGSINFHIPEPDIRVLPNDQIEDVVVAEAPAASLEALLVLVVHLDPALRAEVVLAGAVAPGAEI